MAKDSSVGGNHNRGNCGSAVNKNRRTNYDQDNKNRIPNRIVIRHLPPTMTEEEFLNQIEPLPEHDSYYYANADWSLGAEATCRAYIVFKNIDDIFLFRDRFDGYVFVDNRGNEYPAIVEFAPYQNFTRYRARNVDNKVNTIEDELMYQQFLKQLEEERAAAKNTECKIEFTLDRKKEEVLSTPLLEYIASKREKRLEENRRRGKDKKHSHDLHEQNNKGNWIQSSSGGGGSGQGTTTGSGTSDKNHAERKENADGGGRKYNEDDKINNNTNNGKSKGGGNNSSGRCDRTRRRSDDYKKRAFERNDQMEKKNDKRDRRQNRRDRNHNKNSQGRSSNNNSNNTNENSAGQTRKDNGSEINHPKSTQPKEILKKSTGDEESLTDSVRTFIFQAAQNIQPKGEETTMNSNSSSTDNQAKRGGRKNNTNEMHCKVTQIGLNEAYSERSKGNENNATREEKREERRIRNKDRPSIAIYQPKALLRLSEETETTGSGNRKNSRYRNNNTEAHSDEGVKDNSSNNQQQNSNNQGTETRSKRVQRYSERARNRQKQGGYNNNNNNKQT